MSEYLTPLYKGEHLKDDQCPFDANTGLWYDKFCNQWKNINGTWNLEKKKWLESVQKNKVGDPNLLNEMVIRYIQLVQSLGGEIRFFRNTVPFVTGLGRTHPVETGFTWHYNLGVPYLPGSSVKGVVRAWAEDWRETSKDESKIDLVMQIFGPKGNNTRKSGQIIFFDALPIEPVILETDVMTPHYAPYYQDSKNAPGDWYNPIPIPFLTVAPKQIFVFGVAPRKGVPIKDLEMVLNWLNESLCILGAGAKTAVGYGCFKHVDDPMKSIPKNVWEKLTGGNREPSSKLPVSEQNLTPIQQQMQQDGYRMDNDQIFMQALTRKWLELMEAEEIEISERKEIAKLLAAWYQSRHPKQWQKPTGKNAEKVQRIKNALKSLGI